MAIWKSVKGYDNQYWVSDEGQVISLKKKGRILKTGKDKDGYLYLTLCVNGKQISKKVHRLVAEAFLENPDNLPCINHKNEIKTDNNVENLEFCSVKYNNCYGTRLSKVIAKKTNGKKSKPVFQYDLQGNFIKKYPSIGEVKRLFGFNAGSISNCCLGRCKQVYNYIWKYKESA